MLKRIIPAIVAVLIFNTPAFTSTRCEDYMTKCENTPYAGYDDNAVPKFCWALNPTMSEACTTGLENYMNDNNITFSQFKPDKQICKDLVLELKKRISDFCEY